MPHRRLLGFPHPPRKQTGQACVPVELLLGRLGLRGAIAVVIVAASGGLTWQHGLQEEKMQVEGAFCGEKDCWFAGMAYVGLSDYVARGRGCSSTSNYRRAMRVFRRFTLYCIEGTARTSYEL